MSCTSLRNLSTKFSPLCVLKIAIFLLASLAAMSAAAQTVTTLVPSSYVTTAGGDGGQPVASSIDLLDETGYNPVSGKYVPFLAASAGVNYAGYRSLYASQQHCAEFNHSDTSKGQLSGSEAQQSDLGLANLQLVDKFLRRHWRQYRCHTVMVCVADSYLQCEWNVRKLRAQQRWTNTRATHFQ